MRIPVCLVYAAFLALLILPGGCGRPGAPPDTVADHDEVLPTPDGSRFAPEEDEPAEKWVTFEDATRDSGVDFVHVSGTSDEKPFPAANGSGFAAIDFDVDGYRDLYFATGSPFQTTGSGELPRNRLYRNLGGWRFASAPAAGLNCSGYSAGTAVGDFDGDGFPDVYVTSYGENRLFHNQGDGTFSEMTACRDDRWATSAAFFDADGDGLLDLYVCNYAKWGLDTNAYCGDPKRGVRIFCSPRSVEPELDVFYRNAGDGQFEDKTAAAGLAGQAGRGQGVLAADLNDDGRTDLYVGNDQNPNFMFLANDDGTFRDQTEASGAAYDRRGAMQAGMGVAVADVDGNGKVDLFVTNYAGESNTLYLQSAGDLFNDGSHAAGVAAPGLRWVGWGIAFADFDFDGWQDLVVTNGHTDDNLSELGRDGDYAQPPLLFRNVRGRFKERSRSAGGYFCTPHVGRGLAIADLDDDLDWDLVVGHQDAAPVLLRNVIEDSVPRVRLRLVGTRGNRDAFGATVTVTSANLRQVVPVTSGGSYLCSNDGRLIIAAPAGTCDIVVRWPWGDESHLDGVSAGDYVLVEPSIAGHRPRLLPLVPPSNRLEIADGRIIPPN